jgi:hypothetical protein
MTMAGSGHPWVISVPPRVTVSAEVRRLYNAVPFVTVNVLRHAVQRKRWSLRQWIRMVPLSACPLPCQIGAEYRCGVYGGPRDVVVEHANATRRYVWPLAPHFLYKQTSSRFSAELLKTCSMNDMQVRITLSQF